jgi:hypothetical protein
MAKARELTGAEIEAFAARPGVKRVAVENFLMTVHCNGDVRAAQCNLESDEWSYGWNSPTVQAIRAGIELAFRRK